MGILLLANQVLAQPNSPAAQNYPRLMGMNIGAKNYHEPAYQEMLAKLDVIVLGFFPGWRGDRRGERIGEVVRSLLRKNENALIGQYTILNESLDDPVKGAASRDRIDKLDAENWWLRKADGSKAAWTSHYSAYDVNFTEWTKPDGNGDRYPQWLAKRDHARFFEAVPQLKVWYLDNVMIRSRVPMADWKQQGTNIPSKDPAVESAYRRGMVAHWSAIKKLRPDVLLLGNVDNDLSSDEYRGQLHGAFLESLMGKSWSLERTLGWRRMMDRYFGVTENLLPPAMVGFNVSGDPNDLRFFRYAYGSSLMGNGYFSFTDEKRGHSSVPWFDEYDADYGRAIDPPQREPALGKVYKREFQNALVLLNPENQPQEVEIPAGWRRLKGSQAPDVNTGEPATRVRLPPRDGIVLLKTRSKG